MRKFESYLRIILILSLAYTGAEFVVKDPNYKLALFNPYVIGFLFFILIILVSFEVIIGVLQNISDQLMTEERRLAYEEKKNGCGKSIVGRANSCATSQENKTFPKPILL